jgi:hypothetical protein
MFPYTGFAVWETRRNIGEIGYLYKDNQTFTINSDTTEFYQDRETLRTLILLNVDH